MSLGMDVSSSKSITTALDEIIFRYKKPPSIVVNSAGISKDNYLLKMSEQDFDDVINVNLKVADSESTNSDHCNFNRMYF